MSVAIAHTEDGGEDAAGRRGTTAKSQQSIIAHFDFFPKMQKYQLSLCRPKLNGHPAHYYHYYKSYQTATIRAGSSFRLDAPGEGGLQARRGRRGKSHAARRRVARESPASRMAAGRRRSIQARKRRVRAPTRRRRQNPRHQNANQFRNKIKRGRSRIPVPLPVFCYNFPCETKAKAKKHETWE